MKIKASIYVPILLIVIFIFTGFYDSLLKIVVDISDNVYLSIAILQIFILLLPVAFYAKLRNLNFFQTIKFKYFKVRYIPFILTVFSTSVLGMAILKYITFMFLGDESSSLAIPSGIYAENDEFLILLCFVIIPAFLEEVVFRGFVLREYCEYGEPVALLVSSLAFAGLHFTFEGFITYFFAGLLLGLLALVCESIVPSLILHLTTNILNLYVQDSFIDYLKQMGSSVALIFILISVFLFFVYLLLTQLEYLLRRKGEEKTEENREAILIEALKKEDKEEKNQDGNKENKKTSFSNRITEVLLSPTFLILIVIFTLRSAGT